MSLSQLSSNWREWLVLNVERGCAVADLMRDMEAGGIDREIAVSALREVNQKDTVVLPPLPQLDLAKARVTLEMMSPRVVLIDGFLSADECNALVRLGQSSLKTSSVVDQDTGRSVQHPARTGSLSFIEPGLPLIDVIEARISRLLRWPLDAIEHLQVIGYGPADEYRPHHDCFDESSEGAAAHLQRGGQRVGTLLMYLQEPTSGGETSFPRLGQLRVKPRRGAALWFQNVRSDGRADPRLLHAGEPVDSGNKWICTAWVRQHAWRRVESSGDAA